MTFREIVVAKINDLKDGEMKPYEIAEDKRVLLVKINGEFHAVGGLCPHYGASLDGGILSGLNRMPSPDEIRNKSVNLIELLKNWNSRLRQAA
jgi:nitrite reductase/ring-hydroxylating ferredoxin subunit